MAEIVDGRRARGAASRARVLNRAAEVASVSGLNGLSLGQLGEQLQISKSGVHALFGTKEELQLATVADARRRFTATVVAPVWDEQPGLVRLAALLRSWLDYIQRREFPGGCFVTHCSAEFATQDGPVRDALVTSKRMWLDLLTAELETARRASELPATVDERQLAFEIDALLVGGNNGVLLGDERALERAGRAVSERLSTASGAIVTVAPS